MSKRQSLLWGFISILLVYVILPIEEKIIKKIPRWFSGGDGAAVEAVHQRDDRGAVLAVMVHAVDVYKRQPREVISMTGSPFLQCKSSACSASIAAAW